MVAPGRRAPARNRPSAPTVAVCALLACNWVACEPSGVVVAERDAGSDALGEGGSDGGPTRGPRGRVVVEGERLLTDRGTLLRGVTFSPDSGFDFEMELYPAGARDVIGRYFDKLALESGVNVVHVYLENQFLDVGSRVDFGNVVVDEAERAGLYVIIALGSGVDLGGFDPAKAAAFWNLYAPLYADRTHVLYELHNAPERPCSVPWMQPSIDLERDLYALVRSHAPDTHVIAFSYLGIPTDDALLNGLERADFADWTNASVGFHAVEEPPQTPPCRPISDLATLPPFPSDAPVARFATELPRDIAEADVWKPAYAGLETRGIGWASFRWLKDTSNLDAFRADHAEGAGTWCPDFGTWPMDSATCSE